MPRTILAHVSRSLGRLLSALFGWAVVGLFGQTSVWILVAATVPFAVGVVVADRAGGTLPPVLPSTAETPRAV